LPWSDEKFRDRVVRRCEELGKSQRQVLKAAGVTHDFLQATPAHGRRIDTIERIAEQLDWGLADVLGLPFSGQIDAGQLLHAHRAAQQAAQTVRRVDDEIFCEILATIYNLLQDRAAAGQPVDDPEYLRLLVDVFAKQVRAISTLRMRRSEQER